MIIEKMRKLSVILILGAVLLSGGCGLIARLGSPSSRERVIPAEYNLAEREGQSILVLVNQPGWLSSDINLRFRLTKAITEVLVKEAEIGAESFIGYDRLFEFRSGKSNFSLLSAPQVGEALDADMVLLVEISDYDFSKIAGMEYYKGLLSAQSALFDTSTGTKLWPITESSRSIKIGFEVEKRGREFALARFVAGTAHAVTRHLYDCPWNKFKFADDRNVVGWEEWK